MVKYGLDTTHCLQEYCPKYFCLLLSNILSILYLNCLFQKAIASKNLEKTIKDSKNKV